MIEQGIVVVGRQLTNHQSAWLKPACVVPQGAHTQNDVGLRPGGAVTGSDQVSSSGRIVLITEAGLLSSAALHAALDLPSSKTFHHLWAACHPGFPGIPLPGDQNLHHRVRLVCPPIYM